MGGGVGGGGTICELLGTLKGYRWRPIEDEVKGQRVSSMSEYLRKIKSPGDVKKLGLVELERLAEEIRERLITGVAKTGGHIGPNLGVVELTIAMHYVFDTPRERLYAADGE